MSRSRGVWIAAAFVILAAPFSRMANASDARIISVPYDSNAVVPLNLKRGFVTQIALEESEEIMDVAVGDSLNWIIVAKKGEYRVYIKPKGMAAHSNLLVVTNKRSYSFDLNVLPDGARSKDDTPEYKVSFRYAKNPEDSDPAHGKTSFKPDTNTPKLNRNYSMQAAKDSESITPNAAYDDGRFTYVRIPNNREIPAIFERADDGVETLINFHIEGDLIVIHRVSKRFVLRLGKEVVGVWNDAWDPEGNRAADGTVVDRALPKLRVVR